MEKNLADAVVIGSGTTAQVYLQTFNAVVSAIIGLLTIFYICMRIKKELSNKKNC